MAEKTDPAFVVMHASAHAGEGPFPNSREQLFTEAIGVLQEQAAGDAWVIGNYQKWLRESKIREIRYRRQRNGLIAVITGIAVNSYMKARERREAERVNPPRGM